MLVKGLDDHLTDTLAGAHNIGWIYRLVGTDHDKPLYAGHSSRLSHLKGTENIVLNRLIGTVFHQRYVLMCCCMVHNIRFIMIKYPVHTVGIPHRSNEYHQIQIRMRYFQFLLHIVHAVFVDIYDNQLFRRVGGYLSAKFTADRAAATGNQNRFILYIAQNGIQIYLYRFPAQQIFYFHIPQFAYTHITVYQLIHARQRTQFTVGFLTDIQDCLHLCSGNGGNRNDNLIDLIQISTFNNLVTASNHFDTLNKSAPFTLIIIDDAFDFHGRKITVNDLLDDHIGSFAGTNDHNRYIVILIVPLMLQTSEESVRESAHEHHGNQYERIDKVIALRNRLNISLKKLQSDCTAHTGQKACHHKIL